MNNQVSSSYTIQVLSKEHVQQQRKNFDKLLESLGEPSIIATREFLAEREAGEPEEGLTEKTIARFEQMIADAKSSKKSS